MTQPTQLQESAAVARVVELLLVGARAPDTASAVLPVLEPFGVSAEGLMLALRMTDRSTTHRGTSHLPRLRGRSDVARAQQRQEATYRAWYLLNASRRLSADLRAGKTPRDAVAIERRYWQLHEQARKARTAAAGKVAAAAEAYGPLLGWWAHGDDKTTPECRAADGADFNATERPRIGWPGQPHGGSCRCWPGPPFHSGRTVDQATAGIAH